MKVIDLDALAAVSGGMQWEQMRPSTNVEDRRDWTPAQTRRAKIEYLPEPVVGPRTPGDLPSQAGLDDIDGFVKRYRAERRRR